MIKKRENKNRVNVGFWTMWPVFKWKIVKHALLTIARRISLALTIRLIAKIFESKRTQNNYSDWIVPEHIQKWIGIKNWQINRSLFVLIGIAIVIITFMLGFLDDLLEHNLRIDGFYYIRSLLLKKFRSLSFENKQLEKKKINNLLERDASNFGRSWEWVNETIIYGFISVTITLLLSWKEIKSMTSDQWIISFFSWVLISLIFWLLGIKVNRNERSIQGKISKEWEIINKEREQSTLIESMGLDKEFQEKQKNFSRYNKKFILHRNIAKVLATSNRITSRLVVGVTSVLLFFTNDNNFEGIIIGVFGLISENIVDVFDCLRDSASYPSSCERISDFLSLPEKDDNLQGIKILNDISLKTIKFNHISFRYLGQDEWILKDHNLAFSNSKINYLGGSNGVGKSTMLYLILGVIKPQKGQITIQTTDNKKYDLSKMNRLYWRTNNVAYMSHETLLESGSTGQKQLANIKKIMENKKNAYLWILDEADNALDKEKKHWLKKKLNQLTKEGKIIIYVSHEKNEINEVN